MTSTQPTLWVGIDIAAKTFTATWTPQSPLRPRTSKIRPMIADVSTKLRPVHLKKLCGWRGPPFRRATPISRCMRNWA